MTVYQGGKQIRSMGMNDYYLFNSVEIEETVEGTYTVDVTMYWTDDDVKYYTVRVVTDHDVTIDGTCGEDSCSCDMLHDGDQVEG